MNTRAKFVVVTSSTCLVALLLLGGVVSKGAPADESVSSNDIYHHLAVYSEVLSRIKSEYVTEPDMSSVTLGAMNGLLESIDPYASYLNTEQYKEYLKNFDTYKADLGMVLAKKFGYITIIATVPGSPAAQAGLTTGDMLESIKGIATRDMPLAYAELLLKGAPNSTVELSVLRRKPEPEKLTLARVVVTLPSVESKMMPDGAGYIKVADVAGNSVRDVTAAVNNLQKQGAKKLLLDLRNSATGDPQDGIELANLFLDKGLIAYTSGQKSPRKDFNADPKKDVTMLPLVVMVNRGTAAAAEVAAAALQDNKRATIVGEHTYGDASILKPITMDDGSAIILSVAKYYSPSGKSIQNDGVNPDQQVIEADATVADADDDSDQAAQAAAAAAQKPNEDLILKKALEMRAQ